MTVYTSGIYNFTSSSSIDTYGYLYNIPFNPSYPSQSLITSDDDSGSGNGQFKIRSSLQSGRTYVLVVTTYKNVDRGSFSIRAAGPASVGMTSITPSTTWQTTPSTTWQTTPSTTATWPITTSE